MRRNPRLAALVATGAAVVSVMAGISPAMAERTPESATGNSTIQFGGPVLKALEAGTCGPLAATPTGTGSVLSTGAGKVKVKLPVTGLVLADTGAIRIEHAGSGFELSNACYDVRLSNFYIQDLGGLQNTAFFDVLARAKSVDNGGDRIMAFRLDVTPSYTTVIGRPNSVTLKIRGMDLLLGDDGASEFNQLATGDPNTGPFVPGQLIGKGANTVRFGF